MPKKIKQVLALVALVLLAVFVFAPVLINETAFAKESKERDWDRLTRGGELRDSATETSYAVLLDAHTGKVLYSENGNSRRYPASITKIMTCLVVLENANLQDTVTIGDVKVDDKDAKLLGLKKGEIISVEDLLYGLMLESGNDAGVALAKHVAGSVEAFSEMMNSKAAEIGMSRSHFVNPHGLHDSDHYTTAMDMATLAYHAMKNATFRKIVSTYYYTPPTTNKHNDENLWYPKRWDNSNLLISPSSSEDFAFNDSHGHAIGIKTGYTGPAESTLVSAAVSADGTQEVIAVVLYDSKYGKWTDCITMFMYAFDFYDTIDIGEYLTQELTLRTHVENAADNKEHENLEMYVVPEKKSYITDSNSNIAALKDNPDRFTRKDNISENLVAPISKGDEVGTVDFYLDGASEPILTCTLIAANDVEEKPSVTPAATPTTKSEEATPVPEPEGETGTLGYVGYVLAGAAGFALAAILFVMIKRKAKYHQYHVSARGKHSADRFKEGANGGFTRRE